eukprot:2932155-Amphidinium_carterae.1
MISCPLSKACDLGGWYDGHEVKVRLWSANAVGSSEQPSEPLIVQPSSRPKPVTSLECVGRHARALQVEWWTKDPEGAPIEECTLEVTADKLLGSWQPASSSSIGKKPMLGTRGRTRWEAKLEGLDAESSYLIRVFAKNAV